MKKNNSFPGKFLLSFFSIFLILIAGVVFLFVYFASPVSGKDDSVSYKVKVSDGESLKSVSRELQNIGVIKNAEVLYYAARFNVFNRSQKFNLKSGLYTVSSSMSLKEIYMLLQSGQQEYISVVIPEGLTKSKIAQILENSGICSFTDFIEATKSQSLLEQFNIPAENFEGYLFPDTYYFSPGMNAEDVVSFMVKNFFSKIEEFNLDVTPEKLHSYLTLASIVEREYRIESEAPLIASVFTNRLRYNIGLYSCATVEYIITEILGRPHPEKITYKDLKLDSPYNTYLWAGLPPGPISNPGLVAIKAAINPAKTNYYYFVLNDSKKGSHTFSKDFDEHREAENINFYSRKD